MKAWIARDTKGDCELFCNKPKLVEDEYEEDGKIYPIKYWTDEDCSFLEVSLDEEFHQEVTFENSPQLIDISDKDFLTILYKKREAIIESQEREHEKQYGFLYLSDVSMDMGSLYVLNHIISLLEIGIFGKE